MFELLGSLVKAQHYLGYDSQVNSLVKAVFVADARGYCSLVGRPCCYLLILLASPRWRLWGS